MAQIIKDLNDSSTVYNIDYIDDGNDRYDPMTNTIYWDPTSALLTTCGGKQTPALGLGHEMAHADASYWDQLIGWIPWPGYDNLEERRVITGPETDAARTLGEETKQITVEPPTQCHPPQGGSRESRSYAGIFASGRDSIVLFPRYARERGTVSDQYARERSTVQWN